MMKPIVLNSSSIVPWRSTRQLWLFNIYREAGESYFLNGPVNETRMYVDLEWSGRGPVICVEVVVSEDRKAQRGKSHCQSKILMKDVENGHDGEGGWEISSKEAPCLRI